MRNLTLCLLSLASAFGLGAQQKNDEAYTAKIREYTTESFLTTELVDHLPASATVPTPDKVLGHIVRRAQQAHLYERYLSLHARTGKSY